MSDEPTADTTRRTFMKGVGLAAGAAAFGLSTGTASAAHGFDAKFANWRVREASKVWQRGYTGHPERSLAITDSGVEARHPDLGPWNGVQADIDTEGELVLVDREASTPGTRSEIGTQGPYTGTLPAGGPAPANMQATHRFFVPTGVDEEPDEFSGLETVTLEAELSWSPAAQDPVLGLNVPDLEFYLDENTGSESDPTWERVATAATGANPERIVADVKPGTEYRFVADTYANAAANYEVEGTYVVETGGTTVMADPSDVFADIDGTVDASTPKTVGWYDAGTRYGTYDEPLDPNGHGSHCSSIMAGSGRASRVDPDEYHEGESGPLLPTDTMSYEVSVDADGGVFGAAYGDGIELFIEGPDGRTIETGGVGADASLFDNTLIDHPAVHEEGVETYTVYARPYQPEGATSTQVGRVEEFVAGATLSEENEGSREGIPSLHAGVSPNSPIVGLQGLGTPTADFGEHAEAFANTFNVRAVNMSWGYVGGAPLGGAAGTLDDTPTAIRQIADAGVLTCAAAGNTTTPANGNGAPAVADEAISVVATDPVDGLTSYSSGGIGGVDEDEGNKFDRKPDVSAPGGAADGYPATGYDLVRAALTGDPDATEGEQAPIRDYTLKAGTSMATPYVTGVTGLVAEAMEFDAPDNIALPEPKAAGRADALRLKQVLLATASQTAFTAAPFHHPSHRPDYRHGERDPFEGYGRVNPDAAVDAVSRDLFADATVNGDTVSASFDETVGLNVPEDSRAVAGYVEVPDGTLDASISFSHYSGGNKGMALENPHLDLFVYDAEQPAVNGEPNILGSAMGMQGTASVSVDITAARDDPATPEDEAETRVVYVVAKLVNVPGGVNTNDIQSNFTLDLSHTATGALPLPEFTVDGTRSDDGSAFTQGQTNEVNVTVTSLPDGVDSVTVTDAVPDGWEVKGFGDARNSGDVGTVKLGSVSKADLGTETATKTYFVEATGDTGQYTFGPAEASFETGDLSDVQGDSDTFGGTDDNTIVGASQNDVPL